MAFIYEMAIRCPNQWVSQALAEKYTGQTVVFNGSAGMWPGPICRFRAGASHVDGEHWVSISPTCVTESGLAGGEEECKRANEFCNVIYGMLKNDAYFDYALPGVETSQFATLAELLEEQLKPEDFPLYDGLVLRKDLVNCTTGEALGFKEFSDSHMWLPKKPHVFTK